MAGLIQWFHQARKRRFIRFGLPFLLLMVGGSFGLQRFTSLRYEYKKDTWVQQKDAERYEKMFKGKEHKVSIEQALEELNEKNLNKWQNIRGPRPWEDSKTYQTELRQDGS